MLALLLTRDLVPINNGSPSALTIGQQVNVSNLLLKRRKATGIVAFDDCYESSDLLTADRGIDDAR